MSLKNTKLERKNPKDELKKIRHWLNFFNTTECLGNLDIPYHIAWWASIPTSITVFYPPRAPFFVVVKLTDYEDYNDIFTTKIEKCWTGPCEDESRELAKQYLLKKSSEIEAYEKEFLEQHNKWGSE